MSRRRTLPGPRLTILAGLAAIGLLAIVATPLLSSSDAGPPAPNVQAVEASSTPTRTPFPTAEPTLDLTWYAWNPLSYQPTPTPLPTSTPAPVQAVGVPDAGGWECPALIVEVFGDGAAPVACHVAWCESRYNPNATGAEGERGWFQIHPTHADSTYDPLGNVLAAYRISVGGTTWTAWTVSHVPGAPCKP